MKRNSLHSFATDTLGYCTNVHPAQSWLEIWNLLQTDVKTVFETVRQDLGAPALDTPRFGAGLWLPAGAAEEILEHGHIPLLKDFGTQNQLDFFTLNGFPYGNFTGQRIKERVYAPDWTQPERLDYTLKLVEIASQLGQEGRPFTISTVPISYRQWLKHPNQLSAAAGNLAKVALEMVRAEERTGVKIHLALEPEPTCYLESSRDVIGFFKEYLLLSGYDSLRKMTGLPPLHAQELLLERIQICFDTCHSAVSFEDPQSMLSRYQAEGIEIGKVQLSSALEINFDETENVHDLVEALRPLDDHRFLHQVVGVSADGEPKAAYEDLSDALSDWTTTDPSGRFRIHYHMPLACDEVLPFKTTRNYVDQVIALHNANRISDHWEVETYAWDLLPENRRHPRLTTEIANELRSVLN
ncbi:metabolite traffic protein EboE [bacterium]|nr:metabolite traffic protein EboE [bacterium]